MRRKLSRTAADVFALDVAIAVLASVSAFWVSAIMTENIARDAAPGRETALRDMRGVLPYLFVVATSLTGLRWIAGAAAALTAIGGLFYGGMLFLFSLRSDFFLFVLLQVALGSSGVRAVLDAGGAFPRMRWRWRLVGLCVAAVVALLTWVVMLSAHKAEVDRRLGRAATLENERRIAEARRPMQEAEARRAAMQWQWKPSVELLDQMATCLERFRGPGAERDYPRSLAEMVRSDAVDQCVPRGADTVSSMLLLPHHRIRYTPPRGSSDREYGRGFVLEIESYWDSTSVPRDDAPGSWNFLIDTRGLVHMTRKRRRARMGDPLVPPCGGGGGRSYNVEIGTCTYSHARARWRMKPDSMYCDSAGNCRRR